MFRTQPRVWHKNITLPLSVLCLSLSLMACSKPEQPTAAPFTNPQVIELIQQDLSPVEYGDAMQRTAFNGTIRAVNQSSIQAQVTATASQVNAEVGQKVSRGQVLLRLNNQDNAARLAQARANLASAQAQAQQAANMVQRKKRLYDQGFISKVDYEQSRVDYTGQLENTKAQQANVEIALKADQDGIIHSPINGVITKRQVDPGQTVALGQTLFEIVDPDHLEIQAQLPTEQQAALSVGRQIEYRIQGNPSQLSAQLSRISPIADPASRQIEFFARPQQAINSLSIGAFVEGNILGTTKTQGQLIPLDTIQDLANQPYVWVVRKQKLLKLPVRVLEQQLDQNLAIVSGLAPNDQVSRLQFNADDANKAVVITAQ